MRGLPSLKNVVVDDAQRKAARTDFDTMDEVEKQLAKWGFSLNTTPPPFPVPEVSATQLTTDFNKDYTTMYANQLAWLNYTSPLLAHVKATLIELEHALQDITVKMRKELRRKNQELDRTDRLSEKDIEDVIWCDPSHKELIVEKQRFDQMRLRLQSHVDAMEQNMRVISRQVEIRKLEIDNRGIENRMPQRGTLRTPQR